MFPMFPIFPILLIFPMFPMFPILLIFPMFPLPASISEIKFLVIRVADVALTERSQMRCYHKKKFVVRRG